MKPHPLQLIRLARGWTQQFVAEQINTSVQSIGRWERGETLPQAVLRQRLCLLFGMTAEELGIDRLERSSLERDAVAPFIDPHLPPPLASRLIGREKERYQIKQWLCSSDCPPVVSLYGLPGVGKTALALSVVHDATVHMAFDGVLWASMGPHTPIHEVLQRWETLLGDVHSRTAEVRLLTQSLRARISTRKMLLVLDDIWGLDGLVALRAAGAQCVCLVTTRSPMIAAYAERMLRVRELHEEQSEALLKRLVPHLPSRDLTIRSLIAAVGGAPAGAHADGAASPPAYV